MSNKLTDSELAVLARIRDTFGIYAKNGSTVGCPEECLLEIESLLGAAMKALQAYSDSEDSYWVEKITIDKNGQKTYTMKSIVQLAKLAKSVLEPYELLPNKDLENEGNKNHRRPRRDAL